MLDRTSLGPVLFGLLSVATSAAGQLVGADDGAFEPQITLQPQSQVVVEPTNVTFTAMAVGHGTLSYQWFLGGVSLGTSATNSTLFIPNARRENAGNYWVVVTNQYGSATSTVASLVVHLFNAQVLFRNSGVGFYTPADQKVYGPDCQPLVGTNYLAQLYYLLGTNRSDIESAGVVVSGPPIPFRLPTTTLPGTWASSRESYMRTLFGMPPYETATLQVRVWDSLFGTTYEAAAMNGGFHAASDPFNYTDPGVNPFDPLAWRMENFRGIPCTSEPRITLQPQSRTVSVGSPMTLSALASGRGSLSYQWFRNGRRRGAPSMVGPLTIANAHRTNAGNYHVVVTNSFGADTSQVATVTVVEDFLALGQTAVRTESPGSVPLTLFSLSGIYWAEWRLCIPPEKLTNLEVDGQVGAVTVSPLADGCYAMRWTAPANQSPLPGMHQIAMLRFVSHSNSTSFVPLLPYDIVASRAADRGLPTRWVVGHPGRIAVVGEEPMLDALLTTNQQRLLTLYGLPGGRYAIQMSSNWVSTWQESGPVLTLTNLRHDVSERVSGSEPNLFLRALRITAGPDR